MKQRLVLAAVFACVIGCGSGGEAPPATVDETGPVESAPAPGILEHPFTADQIRDEWVVGLEILIRRWTPEAEAFERWTVVAADADGVDIESLPVDRDGHAIGSPTVRHSGWVELRDHATFPADSGRRERVVRPTPLGELEGWLYTVADPAGGIETEFFFAESLPGAPIWVNVLREGEVVEIFEQVERVKP